MADKTSFVKSKRFKYGTTAVIFTCVFVAAIIVINVITTALAKKYLWYVDMTTQQIYEVSDAAAAILDTIEDTQIKIIFCTPEDKLEENQYQKIVHTNAQNLAQKYDWITLDYVDIITDPGSISAYKTTEVSTIKTTNVIITNGSDFRVFTIEAFYTFAESDNSVFAYNGEYKIISAILQMQGENPICYFTSGHGETTENAELWTLFKEAGYDVRTIDLTKEDIDENAKLIIVNGPKYDFQGAAQDVNEIDKVDRFIDKYGSLLVFLDPGTQAMPELETLLGEWGLGVDDAIIKDYSNSTSVDGTALVATYTTEGLGASLQKSLRELENPPKTIVRNSRPVVTSEPLSSSANVSIVLTTSDGAMAYSTETGEEMGKAPYNLLAISAELRYVDNEEMYTYVMLGGSSEFAATSYLQSNAYGNKDILYSMMKALGREKVPVDLDFKVFEDKTLDLTTAEATRWTIVYTLVLPAIIAAAGVAVFIRRRHL